MSRIRSVHPGLWTDEAFVSLSPMARLLLMGLWNECDDMGSFAWSPITLKMRILPADAADAAALLAEMVSIGIVKHYEVAGKAYGAVRNFCQFQRPKKPNSVHPQTAEIANWVNTKARSTRDGSEEVPDKLPTPSPKARQMEDGGDKGKGEKEEKQPPAAADYVFEGKVIRLTQADFDQWQRAYPALDLQARLQSRDDWLAVEADDRTRKRWFIATSNYLANLQQEATQDQREEGGLRVPC